MPQQIFEQPKLGGLENNQLTSAGYTAAEQVHFEIGSTQHRLRRRQRRAAGQGTDAGIKLCEGKRFDEIIISCLKASDTVFYAAHCSEEQGGCLHIALTQNL